MIVGSGLLAKAFLHIYDNTDDVCIYAAGVSNSGCDDVAEFEREKERLTNALTKLPEKTVFVYFSTCSIYDEELQKTAYVKHKLAMVEMVRGKHNHLIFRLPQVVGVTPNPHTLMNYLYARIIRSESLKIWSKARRNLIDVDDVALISKVFIDDSGSRNITLNVANLCNYSILQIVETLENVLNKKAVIAQQDKGDEYSIDVQDILPAIKQAGVNFDVNYLENITRKYYGNK